jgi:CheY-like chemotaxis protein
LIDDLLDLNRLARGKIDLRLQPRDLHRILRNVLEICRGEIEPKDLTVRLELTATDYAVNGDAGRLQQVFWNLLKNATKFTPADGAITVLSFNPRPGIIRVEVADTGIGIAPQIMDRLFVPFEQGKAEITRRFGGMGLGLAISKAVVDLHGGKIWAASEGRDKGATFTVELPFTHSEVSMKDDLRPEVFVTDWRSKIGDRKLRILLVEDNVDTLQTLSRLLERNGCSVTAAGSMGAALAAAQAAREGAEKFDLVVSDLGLPDGGGQDLMRELRDRDGLSGIALSGYGMEEDIEKSRAAGFHKHLIKPVQFEVLQAAISELVVHLPN